MKRSEIIKLLTQYLAVDREGIQDAREDAEELLNLLEKKGMLPPECQPYKGDWSPAKNEWEPEDETNE